MSSFFVKQYHLDPNQAFLEAILAETENLYLCGIELSKFFDINIGFFRRIDSYLGCCLNCEPTVLSMIALKMVPGTKYVQGTVDGTPHCWVEFMFGNEKYVADLSWDLPFIEKRKDYYESIHKVIPKWVCGYNDFWDLPLTKSIYDCMQSKETSEGIFEYLSEYCRADAHENYGFGDGVLGEVVTPEAFFPYKINGKVISSEIIKSIVFKGATSPREINEANALYKDIKSCAVLAI